MLINRDGGVGAAEVQRKKLQWRVHRQL
jgi:hypothetical protein